MATMDDTRDAAGESVVSLVGGIVTDVKQLLKQNVEMLRSEVREDLRKTKQAAQSMFWSGVLLLVGLNVVAAGVVGGLMFALPRVPWWAWAGIVGACVLFAAWSLLKAGQRKLASFNPLPDQTARAAKENLQCLTHH